MYAWFQTFAMFWTLYAFNWVIPRRLNFICRRSRTHCLLHLHRRIPIRLWRWNIHGVLKHQHIKFRRQGITQKKAYKISRCFNMSMDPAVSITGCWWCHIILGVTAWTDHTSNRSTPDMHYKICCNYGYNTVLHHLYLIQNSSLGYNEIKASQVIYCFKFWLMMNILKTCFVSITCHSGKWPYDFNI